jgi:hypothetical protein
MTPDLPAMATLSEIVGTAVRAATHRVSEGSRRNARAALEARYDATRQARAVIAGLRTPSVVVTEERRSA